MSELLKLGGSESTGAERWLVVGHRLLTRADNGHRRGPATGSAATAGYKPAPREHRVAVLVDELVGPEEVVVRPLPPLLRRHPLLSGATLSGAGEIMLLLDGHRFLDVCVHSSTRLQAASADGRQAHPDATSKSPRVLVVDDSLSARLRLVEKLRERGMEVTEAGDGVAALDLLRAVDFDAIFSDLEMPRLGGFDLLSEVKSPENPKDLPVVIVTSRAEENIRTQALELGADGFLNKPVTDRALQEVLDHTVTARAVSEHPTQQSSITNHIQGDERE